MGICLFSQVATGQEESASSSSRGGLEWIVVKISLSNTGTGCPGEWWGRKILWLWCLGMWFGGSAGVMVGLR